MLGTMKAAKEWRITVKRAVGCLEPEEDVGVRGKGEEETRERAKEAPVKQQEKI